jgi:hypothetical protein
MLKIPNTKRAGGMAQGVGPEFKPQYHKKKSACYPPNTLCEELVSLCEYTMNLWSPIFPAVSPNLAIQVWDSEMD